MGNHIHDSELHAYLRHLLKLAEPRGVSPIESERIPRVAEHLEGCASCRDRFCILERGEKLRADETASNLLLAGQQAVIPKGRLMEMYQAEQERRKRFRNQN